MIYSLAHRKTNANPYTDFNAMVSEGNLAFVIAAQKFNAGNDVKFSTYLWRCADNAMNTLAAKEAKRKSTEVNSHDVEFDSFPTAVDANPEREIAFKQWITALSGESQFVIGTVWNTPADIIQWAREENYCPRITIKLITRHLRLLGWKWAIIRSCYREIRMALKSF